ncbi:arylsulfatase [Pinibacter soli]|uniref:Arylsulfatase n=1 Tax=Pinibacter soli TaxID=3044211 RepID=A0ABT6R9L7_9BACT|nr:arylsulfatase [Pinibacter soli]MDI3319256.1 arylsulfatase [Pinibacter soli]
MLTRSICLSALVIFFSQIGVAQQNRKPNIVFILADDLGYGDIQPYGQKLIQTPNLNILAKEGMKYTQFYAGTSVCAPSRSSLMTGQHTGHTPIRGNKEVLPEGQVPIPDSTVTIAEIMKKAGYSTGLFGKWGLGFPGSDGDPVKQGFDKFYGFNCQAEAHRYYPTHLWDNTTRVDLEGNDSLLKTVTYAPELIQQKALQFIDDNKSKPFVLFLTYTLPHAELLVPDDSLFQVYKGRFTETPYRGIDYGNKAKRSGYTSQQYPRATFAAMVTRLDMYVGQVMNKLKALGLDDNTLIIFTSDNGPHIEGGADPKFFNSSGGLRGEKRDLYEGGIREPFIVKWKGKVKAGSTNNYAGGFWDVMPTLAQIANEPVPTYIDGISFLPSMTGKKQASHDYLYWEFHESGGRQAVRFDQWKCVRLNVDDPSKTTVELYNLDNDKEEKNNVAGQHKDIKDKAIRLMNQAHSKSNEFPFAYESK